MSGPYLEINPKLRLRPFQASDLTAALSWYVDPVVLSGSIKPGRIEPCGSDMISAMYKNLSATGDLFIIEALDGEKWRAIGDVTLAQETMPIVIGHPDFRAQGIAAQVIRFLLNEARNRGWPRITLKEIYQDNLASQRLFESCGFQKICEKDQNFIYEIKL